LKEKREKIEKNNQELKLVLGNFQEKITFAKKSDFFKVLFCTAKNHPLQS